MATESRSRPFLCGVIEGFYGKPWSHTSRLAYAPILAQVGLNTCLYCPKGDPWLRRQWQQHWPQQQWRELEELSRAYASAGVAWGVGLSPFELYRHYGSRQRQQLRDKVSRLETLGAPILAVLFDDMPGDVDALADRQAEIVSDISVWLPQVRLLTCPTYYSFDPVLERHFGDRPEDYWACLGRSLPEQVDVFWTGNTVCASTINAQDIQRIHDSLGRPVVLWDNYPVNDGAKRSNFLYTSPLSGRSEGLRPLLGGHLCNLMNQPITSLPAISGLTKLYIGNTLSASVLQSLLGPQLWALLQRDAELFEHVGLNGLPPDERCSLAAEYAATPGAGGVEVAAWLRGDYAFDPDCLTE